MLESTFERVLTIDNDFLLVFDCLSIGVTFRCTLRTIVAVAISKGGLTIGTKCRNHRGPTSRAILICFRSSDLHRVKGQRAFDLSAECVHNANDFNTTVEKDHSSFVRFSKRRFNGHPGSPYRQ